MGSRATARKRKARNAGFYANLEKRYGVPAGILIAIHGMETAYGKIYVAEKSPNCCVIDPDSGL